MREARRFTDFIHAQVTYADPNRARFNKTDSRRIAQEAGVLCARELAVSASPYDFDFAKLPESFVIKADGLAAKRGVFLLRRDGDAFYEYLRKTTFSEEEVKRSLAEAIGDRKREIVIVEELLKGENDGIPYDYKFYMFGKRNPYILQINRNVSPNEVAVFGSGFTELDDGLVTIGKPGRKGPPEIPANASDMIEAARRVAVHINRPFISVDMYTTGGEAILGEVTPAPGAPYYGSMIRFSDEFDVELGTYWRIGCEERGWPIPRVDGDTPATKRLKRDLQAVQKAV